MPYTLNNIETKDEYDPTTALICTDAVKVQFAIFNASAYVSIGTTPGIPTGAQQGEEILYGPGVYILDRFASVLAVRSGATGAPARANLAAWRKTELS